MFSRTPRLLSAIVACATSLACIMPAYAVSIARDEEIEEYVWSQVRPIYKAAGIDANAVTIYLVEDPSLNAFVSGGQNMFLFMGLFDHLDTPNQLLGVMAHETGHMAGGHLVRGGAALPGEVAPFLITMLAGLAAALAGAGDAGMGIVMASQQMMQRSVLAYTRVQESSADQAAITFLDRIHKSGRGMMEVFEKMKGDEILTDRMIDPYAQSHPLSEERLAALEDRVGKSPFRDVPDTPEDIARYNLIRAKIRGFMNRPDMTLRLYPESDTSDAGHYARAIAYYRSPDFPSANREIDVLLKTHPDNPFFWELKGQILAEQRDFRGAAQAFGKSVAIKPHASLLEVNLAATLLALGDPSQLPKARELLEDSVHRDPTNAFAWLELSAAYAQLGNVGMASLAMAEQRFNMGQYDDAMRFAARARKILPKGSREAQRADDIVAISESQDVSDDEKHSGGNDFTPTFH